ncbi:nuclear transport factor 2 family protein [Maritimibacter sp. UBA3975]|uniref:nuclear transport factor 2 family protein n=1 Tax=Maritimibacter sp. UBA3975 TaxID=1946833 RepID=UPI0025C65D0A|nr:nuclear transport factor 2 family protein [Maritimibacter sp. UBA3975]|tara:strand:- start:15315 stop:15884 length:570 start_codon:yes stop_codon:yes gene_type:complete
MNRILTTAALAVTLAAPALAQGTFPTQHWATNTGIANIQPNSTVIEEGQVADVMNIQQAFSRWGVYYDEGSSDLIPSLFTVDATTVTYLGTDESIADNEGHEAIATYIDSSLEGQLDQRRHVLTNFLIDELTEDTAKAMAYGTVIKAADGLSLGAMVFYSGELEKGDDGVWKFSKLTIGIDDYAGNLSN